MVLVDSGSVDGSREIALDSGCRVIDISHHDFTFGYSLNVGIKAGNGRFMVIVSAHTVPADEAWLGNLIEPLKAESVAMVFGRQLGVRSSKFGEIEDFRRTFGPESEVLKPPNFFANNANSAIRKDLWSIEPFDETLPGLEDIGWTKHWMTKGYQSVYEAKAALYHIHEETWRQVFHRYYREAVAAHWIGIKGRRHILSEPMNEFRFTVEDLIRSFFPGNNLAAERMNLPQRLKEVLCFRYYKATGTVRGLLDGQAMASPASREKLFFDRSTRAVVVTGPGQASLTESELPEVRPGEVVIRVDRIAVCATDLEIFEGSLGYYKHDLATYPITPGHEFSGTIVEVGIKVTDRHYGDHVVVECIQSCGLCRECRRGNTIGCSERAELGVMGRNGGYAEHVVVPAKFTHTVPSDLAPAKAALIEPLAVILKALGRVWPNGGKATRCAVVGAGPLGHLCALILNVRGHHVRAYDRYPERLAFFEGSDIAVSQDMDQIDDCAVVFEVTGDPDALDTVLRRTSAGTTIVLLGMPYGPKEFSFEMVAAYDKKVIGSVGSTKDDFQAAIHMINNLDLSPFESEPLPLADFAEAWRISKQPEILKVFIDPQA
jgi:2-desacetyl-2-hydroxyethyl bacteriochlorophyllide A dehydrogenase